ncbi:PIH1 domain-containing protein 1 isoform X1 [Callithrix jacchus]
MIGLDPPVMESERFSGPGCWKNEVFSRGGRGTSHRVSNARLAGLRPKSCDQGRDRVSSRDIILMDGRRYKAGGSPERKVSAELPLPDVSLSLLLAAAVPACHFPVWVWAVGFLHRAGAPHPLFLPAEGQGCTAYDVAVNSDFYRRMQNSDFLRELVITIAREGLEDKYNLQLNPEWRMMKNRPFMGSISQQNIRSRQRPRIQELGDLNTSAPRGAESGPEKPHLSLWLEAPDLLLAEIDLPKLDGALGLSLEIGENRLVMGGPQQLYYLDAYIPLQINSDESKAAFHRKRKQLMVAMPLLSLPS